MPGDISWVGAVASLTLVAVAIGISFWNRLGVERSIVWAAARAAIQLIAVGLLFRLIFDSVAAMTWAWIWVVGMAALSTEVVTRRASRIPGLRLYSFLSLAGAVAVTLALLFGLGVFAFEPVTLVVLAGITLGNTLPAAVQATDVITDQLMDEPQRIEGLLSLGFDRKGAMRMTTASAVRTALVPQIERTKVIGLIALPGTMTGMLLAGADPMPAVLAQLVITYLVLGSVGVATTVIVTMTAARAFTADLRLADWVTRAG